MKIGLRVVRLWSSVYIIPFTYRLCLNEPHVMIGGIVEIILIYDMMFARRPDQPDGALRLGEKPSTAP